MDWVTQPDALLPPPPRPPRPGRATTCRYVQDALCQTIPILDTERAYDICQVVHEHGQATLVRSVKKVVLKYSIQLQQYGLTISMAPEGKFSGGKGGGEGDGDGDDGGAGGSEPPTE